MLSQKKVMELASSPRGIVVFSKTSCPYSQRLKRLFANHGIRAKYIEVDTLRNGYEVQATLSRMSGRRTVPQVFQNGQFIGGYSELAAKLGS